MRLILLVFSIIIASCLSSKSKIVTPAETIKFDTTSVQLMNLLNAERTKANLLALVFSTPLVCAASAHVNDVGPKKVCSHVGSDGSSFSTRLKRCGVPTYYRAGEIIACGQKTPAEAVKAWMNSPGHRNIILTRGYNNLGCAYYALNKYWVCEFTQTF